MEENFIEKKMLVALQALLVVPDKIIDGQKANDLAHGLVKQQVPRWNSILQNIQPSGPYVESHVNKLSEKLAQELPKLMNWEVRPSQNGSRIVGSLPLVLEDIDTELRAQIRDFWQAATMLVFKKCAPMLQSDASQIIQHSIVTLTMLDTFEKLDVSVKFPQLLEASETRMVNREADFRKQIDTKFGQYAAGNLDNINNALASVRNKIDEFTETEKNLLTFSSVKIPELEKRVETLLEKIQIDWEGLQKETREFSNLKETILLWRNKARWHNGFAFVFGALFIAGLSLVPYSLQQNWVSGYVADLKQIPADHQFLTIVLLLVPVLSLAWVLKFFAKLCLENFSLSTDARFRDAQVATYLKLLSHPSKPINESERILALTSLFRPLPGTGGSDFSPPTTLELLKDAISGAAAK